MTDTVTDEKASGTDLDERDVRALTEKMTVLPMGGDVYRVVGQNGGGEYRVDADAGRCTCPDAVYRGVCCKHVKRVRYATGEKAIPAWADDAGIDENLGANVDGDGPRKARTDGGVATTDEDGDDDAGEGEDDDEDLPELTYHYEPPEQGGERYVRCEGCGAEVLCSLGADEEPIHYDDCPRSRDGYPRSRTGGHTEA